MKEKKAIKGVSELITIISILLVAVVAVFSFRAWVSSQQQRMGSIDMATATYSVQYTSPGNAAVSLLVRNNMPSSINVANVTAILSNNAVLFAGQNFTTTPAIPVSTSAKSDTLIFLTISGLQNAAIRELSVQIVDPSTNQTQWIKAVGG
ncbi:MAG: hypothetical protein QXK88_01500 [Desulfurococcaceae archaeon]